MVAERRKKEIERDDQLFPKTKRSDSENGPNSGAVEGSIPKNEKDSQSKLSKDSTRKNEAQQGESDLRKRVD